MLDPHPAAILRPQRVPPRLTSLQRRAELMSGLGIDFLAVCQTSPEFLKLSAQTFFDSLVVRRLAAKAMVEGPNFFFGRDRAGTVESLTQMCKQSQIALSIVSPTIVDGDMISSTRIREMLLAGDLEAAKSLLGGPYQIRGQVVGGDKRGRAIGFPTANLDQIDGVVPAPGVYGGVARVDLQQKHLAAIHIGPKPTFQSAEHSSVEVHLLDFSGDLYGRQLLVDFVSSVRDIARFDSAEQLAQQLSRDVSTIRAQLSEDHLTAAGDSRGGDEGK